MTALSRTVPVTVGFLLALFSGAVALERQASGLPTGTGRISGRVSIVEAGQRLPLRRAVVTLTSAVVRNFQTIASTDAQGAFVFDRLGAGSYRVAVAKSGFVTVSTAADHQLETAGDLTVQLDVQRAGAVEGRFIDERGVPIDRLQVTAELVTPALTVHSPASFQANTDDRGRFRIHTLPPGQYRVHALPPSSASGRRLYLPGTEEASEATLVTVGPGETAERLDFNVPAGQSSDNAGATAAAIEREFQMPESPGFDSRISGRVTRTDVGLPLAGVAVTLHSNSGVHLRTAMTDGDGQYAFPRLSPGRYSVTASAAGFISQTASRSTAVTIVSGARVRVDPALVPASAIDIRVIDEFGDPAPGVVLQVTRRNTAPAGTPALPSDIRVSAERTDDRGFLRAPLLVSGEYFVLALPIPFAPSFPAPFAPTYFPGVRSADAATAIQLSAGADAQVSFVLGSAQTMTLSGVVQNHGGQLLAGARLVLIPAYGATYGLMNPAQTTTVATKDGGFVFRNIPEGTYMLLGFTDGALGSMTFAVADPTMPPVVLTLKPLGAVRGTIQFEAGSTPVAVRDVALRFRPESATLRSPFGSAVAVMANWTFEIRNIESPGVIVPSLIGTNWTLSRVLLNGRDITDIPYDFHDGDTAGVQIMLTTRVGTVAGSVRDATGLLSGARVLMFGADNASPHYVSRTTYTAQTNEQGAFEIRRILPGRYYAGVEPAGFSPVSSQAFEAFRKSAILIVVNEGAPTKIELTKLR